MQVALKGTETKRVIAGSRQLSSSCFHSSLNLGCPLRVHKIPLWLCNQCLFVLNQLEWLLVKCRVSLLLPISLLSFPLLLSSLLSSSLLSLSFMFLWPYDYALRLSIFALLQINSLQPFHLEALLLFSRWKPGKHPNLALYKAKTFLLFFPFEISLTGQSLKPAICHGLWLLILLREF